MKFTWNILQDVRWLGIGILLMGLFLIGGLIVRLFVLPPEPATLPALFPERRLNTTVIDTLELWIEEVEDVRRAGLKLPARSVFVVEDIKLEDEI